MHKYIQNQVLDLNNQYEVRKLNENNWNKDYQITPVNVSFIYFKETLSHNYASNNTSYCTIKLHHIPQMSTQISYTS